MSFRAKLSLAACVSSLAFSPGQTAQADPVALTPGQMDEVTAGAVASGIAQALALGDQTQTNATTATYAGLRVATAQASGFADGTDFSAAEAQVALQGEVLSGFAYGAAVSPSGGPASAFAWGKLTERRRVDRLRLTVRVVAVRKDGALDAQIGYSAPHGASTRWKGSSGQRGRYKIEQRSVWVKWRKS